MFRRPIILAAAAVCIGCGVESNYPASEKSPTRLDRTANNLQFDADSRLAYNESGRERNPADEGLQRPAERATENRKIIYTASLSIVVEEFSGVEQAISQLVKQHGGFISSANLSLNQGSERSGLWTVRVPVASYEAFLDSTGDLGVPERREQHGQDVTAEYVDLEARIRSKKKLEERILELLADNKGEIKDVIEVERELSRVRTEVEKMEGRMRYLADRTELTTVTLNIREEKNYVPPQAPGLGSQIASTWGSSIGAIVSVGQGLLLTVVACVPWLVLVAAVVAPVWMWRRRGERYSA